MNDNMLCDKCGQPVPRGNDVRTLCAIMQEEDGNAWGGFLFWAAPRARHLLPVTSPDGKVLCIGSPSRAQYIEGRARDPRPEFPYDKNREWLYRKAFVQMHTETLACAQVSLNRLMFMRESILFPQYPDPPPRLITS